MCFLCLFDTSLITYYSSDIVKQKRSWPLGAKILAQGPSAMDTLEIIGER